MSRHDDRNEHRRESLLDSFAESFWWWGNVPVAFAWTAVSFAIDAAAFTLDRLGDLF